MKTHEKAQELYFAFQLVDNVICEKHNTPPMEGIGVGK